MNMNPKIIAALTLLAIASGTSATTHYVDLNSPNPSSPYTAWATAARTIQDAVDATAVGDEVVVTNGLYATGGRADHSMTNRVLVSKAINLRSVNGPQVTTIKGYQVPGTTNDYGAVRCVYLTNGASLSGFTLTNGATVGDTGDLFAYSSGGGVRCESVTAVVSNCILVGNSAFAFGGGAYGGTLRNCGLFGNSVCGNYYVGYGGGAAYATLNNCTLTGNSACPYDYSDSDGALGGGAYSCTLYNSILYFNTAQAGANYDSYCWLTNCCTTPLPAFGAGNIAADPQLASKTHLSASSPCRGAGSAAYASGTDLDGETWAMPPSMGCDEYQPGAVTGPLSVGITATATNMAPGAPVSFTALIQGRITFSRWDFGDGSSVPNEPYTAHAWSAVGDYAVVLWAYNESLAGGVSATAIVHVVTQPIHYVSVQSTTPAPPYSSWATAATNIQDAVDAATVPGALVLVTNGTYATGGRAISQYGTLNRVFANKLVELRSVNGPQFTTINGSAGRCIYLSSGSAVSGFTLTGGDAWDGGGAWCESPAATISNCIISANSANAGGGVYGGTLQACTLAGNLAAYGGGAYGAVLNNCVLLGNIGYVGCSGFDPCYPYGGYGGGTSGCTLNNCILNGNSATNYYYTGWSVVCVGGGAESSTLNRCTLSGNSAGYGGGAAGCSLNSCTLSSNLVADVYDFNSGDFGGNGGGAYGSRLSDCTLNGNSAIGQGDSFGFGETTGCGGGACNSCLSNCVVMNNSAVFGGGAAESYDYYSDPYPYQPSTLQNCILASNTASSSGGGAFDSALNNSAVSGNSAAGFVVDFFGGLSGATGGGAAECTLINCTITGNSAVGFFDAAGGGVASSALDNCICYFNTAPNGDNYDAGSSQLNYCCTTPLPSAGVGNLAAEPQLASASHLSLGSPCRGAGNAAYTVGTDIDGEPWGAPPSIGCDELKPGAVVGALSVAIGAGYTTVSTGYAVALTALIQGAANASAWDFGDGSGARNQPYVSHAWAAPGDYPVVLTAYNDSLPGGVSATVTIHVLARPTHYVAPGNASPLPPYNSWATAATNIQDAVDAATIPGELVLVTNGAYANGFRADAIGATNRLVASKPVWISSVNGPQVTVLDGAGVVRCVSLGGSAIITGFTMTNGVADNGAGVWCASATEIVSNCVISGNSAGNGAGAYGGTLVSCLLTNNGASAFGAGAYYSRLQDCLLADNYAPQGGGASQCDLERCTLSANSAEYGGGADESTLIDCTLAANSATSYGAGAYGSSIFNSSLTRNAALSAGGGAYGCSLNACALTGNSAPWGGGAVGCTLNNCTVTANLGSGPASIGGGARNSTLNNCILFFNTASQGANYDSGCVLNYCCTTPLPPGGTGNIASNPELATASHISAFSPCRSAGSPSYASGTDIDGDPWANPPSIGCDEYQVGAVTGPLTLRIQAPFTNVAAGFPVALTALIEGRTTLSAWDFGDGVEEVNQPCTTHAWTTAGDHLVSLWAFNESYPDGVRTTAVIHVVAQPVTYVSADSRRPQTPFISWATAATNIQDAVDAAFAGGTVLVTNGTYATGGRAVFGTMTNRVAVDKPVSLRSVNGPLFTRIQGHQVSGLTNREGAIRCVYLTSGASISGFTLTNGATRAGGDELHERNGGGVWCESASASVSACVLVGNSAFHSGGGAYSGTLNSSALTGNSAGAGGGACGAVLNNCTLTGNSATTGGGVAGLNYFDPVTWAWTNQNSFLNNCISYFNTAAQAANYDPYCQLAYSCSSPLPPGMANISVDPQLTSPSHLSPNSACRGAGSTAYARGNDIDGEPWATPPSMGCDEVIPGAVIGALSVNFTLPSTNVAVGYPMQLVGLINGRATSSIWDFGDGIGATNEPFTSHAWSAPGTYAIVLRAYNDSFPAGLGATAILQVVSGVYYVSASNPTPIFPYNSWGTAATNIQDAVDAVAVPGASVLVTNGIYSFTNGPSGACVRVNPGLTLRSVNGPQGTSIDGQGAVGCAYLGAGASLSGFTLSNGTSGLFCESATSVASNCVISGNGIHGNGGGVTGGTLNSCLIVGNLAYHGGGAQNSILIDCTIRGNSAADGGGASFCTLSNCALLANSSSNFGGGGGARYCTLQNCLLTGNSAGGYGGGGANAGVLKNCTLLGNSASYGGGASGSVLNDCLLAGNSFGGAYESTLTNCTLVGNSGSGSYQGTLKNCILYYNDGNGANYSLDSCCTVPMPTSGSGNITNAPLFVDLAGGDLHLQSNSPCINAGNNAYATVGPDLDGNPRIVGGTVDIGAYEFQSPTSTISYAWLQQYGLATDGSADHTDADADGMNNWQEWRCQTDPTNPLSALRLLSPAVTPTNATLTWQSVAGVNYFIARSTNLSLSADFSTIASNIVGQPGTTSYADTNSVGTGTIFYRVGVH
jgi:PKD repeat protein